MQSTRQNLQSLAARVLKNTAPEEAVLLAWPLVCGSSVAERATAIRFENGTLSVCVPDRGWQSQLYDFSAQYSEKLSRLTGVVVERIRYEVAGAEPARYNP
jgi:hypothetical protein